MDRFDFGLALVQEAGALALGYFRNLGKLTIQSKGLQDMASEADLETELLIKRRIAEVFPDDAFFGEETGAGAIAPGQGVWVVDPIDGTQPFLSGLSSWCVSIAYLKDGVLDFGMVYAPARDELFAGGKGRPATLNGAPVRRHPGKSIREGLVATGYSPRVSGAQFLGPFSALLEGGGMFFRDGSGALNLCYVGAGRFLGYMEPHINSWDCLGAIAVIEAAGLKVNDFLAGEGLHKGNPIVAGVPEVFDHLMGLNGLAR
jgi:myo-inositol-1(or 4)-monophosphatase